MRIKTSELTGAALDWAVAKCEMLPVEKNRMGRLSFDAGLFPTFSDLEKGRWQVYTPSTDWSQGGPIIERYCINLFRLDPKTEEDNRFWIAHIDGIYCRYGVSALIAAMRCYIASQLGDDVEIPEGLL